MMYLWIKAFHLIAAISWMVGLLYLPRLFVYHTMAPVGSDQSEIFKKMEYRLIRYIMTPAMGVTWILGLVLIFGFDTQDAYFKSGWFHVKFLCVLILTAMHHLFLVWFKRLDQDMRLYSDKVYRFANEVPTVAMVLVIVMVIVQPF